MKFQEDIVFFLPLPPKNNWQYIKIFAPPDVKSFSYHIIEIKFIGINETLNPGGLEKIEFKPGIDRQIREEFTIAPYEEVITQFVDFKFNIEFGLYYRVKSIETFYRSEPELNPFCYFPFRVVLFGLIIPKTKAR